MSCDDTSADLPTAVASTELMLANPPGSASGQMDCDQQDENIPVEAEDIATEGCGDSDELGQPAVAAVPRRSAREQRAPARLLDYA